MGQRASGTRRSHPRRRGGATSQSSDFAAAVSSGTACRRAGTRRQEPSALVEAVWCRAARRLGEGTQHGAHPELVGRDLHTDSDHGPHATGPLLVARRVERSQPYRSARRVAGSRPPRQRGRSRRSLQRRTRCDGNGQMDAHVGVGVRPAICTIVHEHTRHCCGSRAIAARNEECSRGRSATHGSGLLPARGARGPRPAHTHTVHDEHVASETMPTPTGTSPAPRPTRSPATMPITSAPGPNTAPPIRPCQTTMVQLHDEGQGRPGHPVHRSRGTDRCALTRSPPPGSLPMSGRASSPPRWRYSRNRPRARNTGRTQDAGTRIS